jgi:autotransporter-associated beta strand protein
MKPKSRFALTAALPLALLTQTQAQITFNTANDGGNWGTAGNWTPAAVPNAVDAEAIVNGAGPSGTAPATTALDVVLDGNFTIGRLTRSVNAGVAATFPTTAPAFDVTKGLTLQKSSGIPEINIVGDVFFYSAVFGTQGLEKTGAGRFTFRFNPINHTFTGPVKISAGTLGIQQDGSLGDVNNDIEIAGGARLFAEPGSNSGIITLPATRSITLTGVGAQIGSNNAAVNLVIEGDIGESETGNGLTKTDAGVVTLAGTNSWTGATTINAGVLSATKPAALPGFDSQTYNVNGTSTLAVRYGDASTWTDTQIGDLVANASFAAAAGFGIDTTGNAAAATLTGDLTVANFSKIGAGTLVLADPQTSVTGLSLYGGTLEIGASGGLPAGVVFRNLSGGTLLDLGGTAASFADLQEVSGGATTITNGSLTYTGPTLTLSGNNGTTVDLSGLTTFTYSTSGTELKIENTNNVNGSVNTTLLAAGTNTLTASGRVQVGGGASSNNGPHTNTLRLGTTNSINTALLQLGGFNDAGVVNFQSGLANPSLKLRAADGIAPIPLLKIGETSSGARSGAGTLNLTEGSADISAVDIVIGRHIAGSNNGDTSTFTLPDGTVTASRLLMAEKTSSGSPVINAVFNQLGGSVSIDSIVMGQTGPSTGTPPIAASSVQNLRPTYNLEGGTLTTAEIKPGPLSTALAPQAQVETATAAGTITAAGDVLVTVTGAGIAGSPLDIPVAVALNDAPAAWASKVANALAAVPAVSSLYNVTNNAAGIILTAVTPGVYDATLNVALANGTTTGVTAAPNSANTNGNVLSNIVRTVKLEAGTLVNKAGADLAIAGVTVLVPGNTTAVVDSTSGQNVVFAGDVTFSTRIDSSATSSGTLTVEGDVDISASPALVVFDDATGDAVPMSPGSKLVLIDYQNGSLTGQFAGLADGASVDVTKGAVSNSFILDYNDPAFSGKAVTLTVQGSGNNYASWANDPAKGNIPGEPATGDFDNDGLTNIVEYALGTNPRVSSQPAGVLAGNTITFTKGLDAIANADVTWVIETSPTLGEGSWIPAVTQNAGDAAATISFQFTPGSPARNFARLKVTQVP